MRILKYKVPEPNEYGSVCISMPDHSLLLSVGLQNDQMVLWALVDESTFETGKKFIVLNTGSKITSYIGKFIGTVTTSNGIVWHVFEE
jgi:hypothetical protein